jgi:hypothetical protein
MSGDYKAGWGGHGLAEFSVKPSSRFGVRGSASFAAGGFSGVGGGAVLGLDLLGVVRLGTVNRPYLGLGPGYSHTNLSATQPLAHDLGVSMVAGLEWRRSAATWFAEARTRLFGNVFYERASTQSVLLLSIGRTIG